MSVSIDQEWQQFLSAYSGSAHNLVDFQSFNQTNEESIKKKTSNTTTSNSLSSSDEEIDESDGSDKEEEEDDEDEDEDDDDDDEDEEDEVEEGQVKQKCQSKVVDKKPKITIIRNPCEELYISTQTQIFFLNTNEINVDNIFWSIPVMEYATPSVGVIKKQMRIISKDKDEFAKYQQDLKQYKYYAEKIMKQIDNPKARKIKYKDVRKLTVGVSKKDIMNCHGKNKNAFINCFAMILRVKYHNMFHEIHVKVFNTGKLAIPGIVDDGLLYETKKVLLSILQSCFIDFELKLILAEDSPLVRRLVRGKKNNGKSGILGENGKSDISSKSYFEYVKPKGNVLINSNFNCGYYIQQEKLKGILRDKYKLNPSYDPSMYPGVKCKFFYKNDLPTDNTIIIQNGILSQDDKNVTMTELDELSKDKYTKVSFMVFRTGNCLIVGNCTKEILHFVFEFVKKILMDEYEMIKAINDVPVIKLKKKKPRKRVVYLERIYYNKHIIT
jgi:hypothetical protein